MLRSPLLLLLLSSASAAASPTWVSWSTIGMEDAQESSLRKKVATQLRALGGQSVGVDDAACVDDESCLKSRIDELEAVALIDVRIVLAGDVVQRGIQLFDQKGALVVRDQSVIESSELVEGLPSAVVDALRGMLKPVEDKKDETPDPKPDGEPLSTLGVGGLALTGVGLVMVVGGVAFGQSAAAVLDDPTSGGQAKADAYAAGWASVTVAIVGGIAAVTGGALAYIGFSE